MERRTVPDPAWARSTWEGARLARLREDARLSFAERLAWLESARRLAEQLISKPATTARRVRR